MIRRKLRVDAAPFVSCFTLQVVRPFDEYNRLANREIVPPRGLRENQVAHVKMPFSSAWTPLTTSIVTNAMSGPIQANDYQENMHICLARRLFHPIPNKEMGNVVEILENMVG